MDSCYVTPKEDMHKGAYIIADPHKGLRDGALLPYIRQPARKRPEFFDALDPKVGLLKLTPGCDRRVLDWLLSEHDAVIIESYGVGGLPSYQGSGYFDVLRGAIESGKKTNVAPGAEYVIQPEDNLVVLGENYALEAVQKL